jgi:Amt family ammonium transporter
MSGADTGFMIICAGLVMFMVPGLALFYGGLVERRNVLSTLMHSFFLLGLGSLVWAFVGYSLAFGDDVGGYGLIGSLEHVFLIGVGLENDGPASNMPHLLFMVFQCMFAALTPALISGAYAERMRFSAMVIFSLCWIILIYCPMAHWVWGGGWLAKLGALDFAGGAVVHMSSAAAALAVVKAIGPRKSQKNGGSLGITPHSLPLTVLGAGILWFGWFGFNGGSALAANGVAVNAMVNTHLAAAVGMLGWLLVEKLHSGKPTTLGAASGAIAGLASITPAVGFVNTQMALVIGFIGCLVCYGAVLMKNRFKYDDALDVVGIHGVGGIWGMLATGLFATVAVNAAGNNGLFFGNASFLGIQVLCIVATGVFCYIGSRIIIAVIGKFMRLRSTEEEELIGLDISEHREHGYRI